MGSLHQDGDAVVQPIADHGIAQGHDQEDDEGRCPKAFLAGLGGYGVLSHMFLIQSKTNSFQYLQERDSTLDDEYPRNLWWRNRADGMKSSHRVPVIMTECNPDTSRRH